MKFRTDKLQFFESYNRLMKQFFFHPKSNLNIIHLDHRVSNIFICKKYLASNSVRKLYRMFNRKLFEQNSHFKSPAIFNIFQGIQMEFNAIDQALTIFEGLLPIFISSIINVFFFLL